MGNIVLQEDADLFYLIASSQPSLESQLDPKYLLRLKFEQNPEPYKSIYDRYILEYYERSVWDKPFFGEYQSYFEQHAFDICYEYGLGEVCKSVSK